MKRDRSTCDENPLMDFDTDVQVLQRLYRFTVERALATRAVWTD